MDHSIASYLCNNFSSSSSSDPISLQIVSLISNPSNNEKLSFLNSSHTEDLQCKFLILLIDSCQEQIVSGIDSSLYHDCHGKKRLFIRYVDTTGRFKPRCDQSKVTKLFIEAFIHFIQADKLHLSSIPKPFYLFPYSHKNQLKRPISGQQLSVWWKSVLDKLYKNVRCYSVATKCNNNLNEGKVLEEVPLFPEDIKLSHFNNVYQTISPTNMQFMTSLEASYDFCYNSAAIFYCSHLISNKKLTPQFKQENSENTQINCNKSNSSNNQSNNSISSEEEQEYLHKNQNTAHTIESNCSEEKFQYIHGILSSATFATQQDSAITTRKILKQVSSHYKFTLYPTNSLELQSSYSSDRTLPKVEVHDIQSFVKRKKNK